MASVGFVKIAILLFYRRLSSNTSRTFTYTLYACITFIIAFKVAYLSVIVRTCAPLKARWLRCDPTWASSHQYTCINESANIFTGSTISATEDLVIALLPTALIWRLRLPKKQKFGLWCIFGLSIFTSVAGYIRSYYIMRAAHTSDYICKFRYPAAC